MIASRAAFDKAVKKADEKWTRGAECTEEDFEEYWRDEGSHQCSLCKLFMYCNDCVLTLFHEKGCGFEYERCGDACHANNFPTFHSNALVLRRKIQKLDYDKYVERAKKLGLG